jgi:hypothetical protein
MRVGREELRMTRRETKAGLTVLAAVLIALGTSYQAQAGQVFLAPPTVPCSTPPCLVPVLSGSGQSNAAIIATINAAYPGVGDALLYKATQSDGSEVGAFAAEYSTLFGSPDLPDADATISWDKSGPYINANPVYALIKDGKLPVVPGATTWYFYDLTGWDGIDDIVFYGFFGGNQGKISHVGIYGIDPPPPVPDGGSMAILMGIGLMGLAGFRRFLK